MCPEEFWLEFDAKVKEQRKLKQMQPSSNLNQNPFTDAEWEAARRKYSEMQNGN